MRPAQLPWTGPPCLCGESGSRWGTGYLRDSPPPVTADRKGCTLGVLGPTPVSLGSEGGGRCGAGSSAGAAGGMWEMRDARLAPRPRLGQPVCKVSPALGSHWQTHTHLTPSVALSSCGLFSGPPRPFSLPGFALTNGVNWCVRARALGLVLTRTLKLRRGASLEP